MLSLFATITYASSVVNLKGALSVNQGSLNYSVEIETPVGIAGVAPKLSLVYNSGGANGLLGLGWSIAGLSSISRCGSTVVTDGFNRPVLYDAKDNYCMDGKRLIEIGNGEYRTQIESYSKITLHGDHANPSYFKVRLKSGDIYTYASVDKIANKNTTWAITKIEDRFHNAINFNYINDINGMRISTIDYAEGINTITFNYEGREDVRYGYKKGAKQSFTKKLSSITIRSAGSLFRQYKLKYVIQGSDEILKLASLQECNGESSCSNPLQFIWQGENFVNPIFEAQNSFANTEIEKGEAKIADFNGDGFSDVLVSKSKKVYLYLNNRGSLNYTRTIGIDAIPSDLKLIDIDSDGDVDIYEVDGGDDNIWLNNGEGVFTQSSNHPDIRRDMKYIRFVDMNNDGYVDIYYCKNDRAYLLKNRGDGTFDREVRLHTGINDNSKVSFTDINNDGYLDIVYITKLSSSFVNLFDSNYITIQLSDGYGGFSRHSSLKLEDDASNITSFMIDINGDGLIDVVNIANNSSFTQTALYLGNGNAGWNKHTINLTAEKDEIKFADLNGDGYVEIIQKVDDKIVVWKNHGTDATFTKITLPMSVNDDEFKALKFADMNGDGLIDIYLVKKDSNDVIWRNTTGFIFVRSSQVPLTGDYANRQFADFNGDGLVDIVNTTNGSPIYINQNRPMVIAEVKDSFNNKISINYKHLNSGGSFYSKDTTRNQFDVNLKTSMYAVSDVIYHDNRGESGESIDTYTYSGLKFNLKRGSLGFKQITTENQKTKSRVVTTFYQEFPLTGTVERSSTYVNNHKINSSTVQMETLYNPNNKLYTVRPTEKREDEYEVKSGEYIKSIITDYTEYDNFGNVLKMTTTTKNNREEFSKTTISSYDNNEYEWILGRLTDAKVIHRGGVGGSQTRESSFTYYSNGMLKSETVEPNHALRLTKSFEYDTHGNIITKKIKAPTLNGGERVTRYTYDSDGRFLLNVTNPLGHRNRLNNVYDPTTGNLLSKTDANGETVSWSYDGWGKVIKETRADGTTVSTNYRLDSSYTQPSYLESLGDRSKYSITVKASGSPYVKTYYDSLDRKIRVETQRFDGKTLYEDFYYNALGQLYAQTDPYVSGESVVYTVYTYDILGRTIHVAYDGITRESFSYYKNILQIWNNEHQNTKMITKNVLGKVIHVKEFSSPIYYRYEYDSIGNLVSTVPNDRSDYKISMTYDILGNKTSMNDPDMGYWQYKYDALGNLIEQTDAKGHTFRFMYDKIGRKVKQYSNNSTYTWEYDKAEYGLGKLYREESANIVKEYSYTKHGKVAQVKTSVDGKLFKEQYIYRADAKIDKVISPSGLEKQYVYNASGFLEAIKSPKAQIADFDVDHFTSLIEKTLNSLATQQAKYRELSEKAAKVRASADYYKELANYYQGQIVEKNNIVEKLRKKAKQLSNTAKRYNIMAKDHQMMIINFQRVLNYLLTYYYRVFPPIVFNILSSIVNEYKSQANTSLDKAKKFEAEAEETSKKADKYKPLIEYDKTLAEFNLKEANKLYLETKKLDAQAKYYRDMNNHENDDTEIAQEYGEILEDDAYVYHYKVISRNSKGQVTKFLSGNGLITRNEYEKRGLLNHTTTRYNFEEKIRELNYTYDKNFNLKRREDKKLGIVQEYFYDDLERIKYSTIEGSTSPYGSKRFDYAYDVYGNLTQKDGKTISYKEGTHQVQSVDGDTTAYSYDANGNMLQSGSSSIEYNTLNKPVHIKEGTHDIYFDYDMNGNRYKKSENGVETYYIGKSYEYLVKSNGETETKDLIYADGKVVAIHQEGKRDGVNILETRYLHYDSLGSVDTITNQRGEVVQRMAYKPFGEQIEVTKTEDTITNRGYTGHEHIEGTKLIHSEI